MNHVYKVDYIKWVGDTLHCGGNINLHTACVLGASHAIVADKLRKSQSFKIEIVSISKIAENAIE